MGRTKQELLTSKRTKDQHIPQTHSDGGRHPDFYAKQGEGGLVSHPHSVPNVARGMEHQAAPPTLARGTGKPKRSAYESVPIAGGMLSHNRNTGKLHFGGHEASYDSNPANPLNSGPPAGKRTARAEINPGCRDRSQDSLASENAGVAHARAKAAGNEALHSLGRAIWNEAANNSAVDDRRALGIGKLPDAVGEET
jgi:hypothetical protein